MDDLIAWLRAQLDDDERVAGQMMAEPGGFYIEAETDATNIMTVGAHLYRWTPKRALAQVDATRRILDEYEEAATYYTANSNQPAGEVHGLLTTVRILATAYTDQPGYQAEWSPAT